jgi:hypothetical protein
MIPVKRYGGHPGTASFKDVPMTLLPTDPAERKAVPLCSGVLDYFPSALAEVAKCSHRGNEQHNAGQPLHWAREKSSDHLDCAVRHIVERDLPAAAWRILAALQLECEAKGAPIARGAKLAQELAPLPEPAEVLRERLDATDDDTAAA